MTTITIASVQNPPNNARVTPCGSTTAPMPVPVPGTRARRCE